MQLKPFLLAIFLCPVFVYAQNCNIQITACTSSSPAAPLPTSMQSVDNLDGSSGFEMSGLHPDGRFGYAVNGIGDINHDGFDDISVCAPWSTPGTISENGEIYIIFGNNNYASDFDVSLLDGTNGFRVQGVNPEDRLGYGGANPAGDVNNDGIDDLIITTPYADPDSTNTGSAYVIYGKNGGFSADLSVDMLDGTNGFTLNGTNYWDNFGTTGGYAGDMNADGIDDFYVTADDTDFNGASSGTVYVIYGKNHFPDTMDVDTFYIEHGFMINGKSTDDNVGIAVGSLKDMNGDGQNDLAVGAFHANGDTGAGYVIYGKSGNFTDTLNVANLDGTNGFEILGKSVGDGLGTAIGDAGDLNADGLNDLYISAPKASANGIAIAGQTYIIYGTATAFPVTLEIATLGGMGFAINGMESGSFSGNSVCRPGDINGDGTDDLLVGAFLTDGMAGFTTGEAYLLYGDSAGFPAEFNLSNLDGANGYTIHTNEVFGRLGFGVGSAGDFDGNGANDILLGADFGAPGSAGQNGKAYLLYGLPFTNDCQPVNAPLCKGDTLFLQLSEPRSGAWSLSGNGEFAQIEPGAYQYIPVDTDVGLVAFAWLAADDFSCFASYSVTYELCTPPDSLILFQGTRNDNIAILDWEIQNELQTLNFEVEMKSVFDVYLPIGTVSAQGANTGINSYQFQTNDLLQAGAYYFKLKQNYMDGNYSYSNEVAVTIPGRRGELTGFPNPGIGIFTLGLNVVNDDGATIHISNMSGQLVRQIQARTRTRSHGFTIDVRDLPEGVYFYVIESEQGNILEQGKLVKR